jgi:hypothetical protein
MLLDIGYSAMNAPRCWQLRNETSANTLAALQREWRMGNLSSAFEKADSQWEQIFKCRLSLRRDELHPRIIFEDLTTMSR